VPSAGRSRQRTSLSKRRFASLIAAAVYGKVPFEDLAAAELKVTGREAALAYVDFFHLPAKIY
jgi:hypothetical protein